MKGAASWGMAKKASDAGAIREDGGWVKPLNASPLELAHLTARLVEVGLIQREVPFNGKTVPSETDQRRMIVAASQFLELCGEMTRAWTEAKELEVSLGKSWKAVQELKRAHEVAGKVPLRDVLQVAGLARVTLTPSELKEIGVRLKWGDMGREKREAVTLLFFTHGQVKKSGRHPFEVLGFMRVGEGWSNYSCGQDTAKLARILINQGGGISLPPGGAGDRAAWIMEGVPLHLLEFLVEHLRNAKIEREKEKKSIAGKESVSARAKKREEQVKGLPRNEEGQFTKKPKKSV